MNTKKNLTIVIVGEDNNSITAQVTKAFEKKSKVFGTEEYNIWRDFKADNISKSVIMTTKKIKRNTEKKTNKNLTYSIMAPLSRQKYRPLLMNQILEIA